MADEETGPTGAEKRAAVRSAAAKKAAATRRAQKAVAKKTTSPRPKAGDLVKVKLTTSSWKSKRNDVKTVDADTAAALVADRLAEYV